MFYTGIGSRETPTNVLAQMTYLAKLLAEYRYTLRSGGADGADTAFENGSTLKEIYLPWPKFNDNKSHLFSPTQEAFEIAKTIHPVWDKLSIGAQKLHARNIHQVLGKDLKTPSEFLVCWTKNGKESGGTATAIKLTKLHNIPVYNLFNPDAYKQIIQLITNYK